MKLTYGVKSKPGYGKVAIFAIQQLLAILAATIAVPAIINQNLDPTGPLMSQSAALLGAGMGTMVYLLFTKFRSPVFLGSSFAFLGSMAAAFAGAATVSAGYLGLIIGAICAGLVYVVIAMVVKFAGVNWINKLMPAVVIGPTVAIIGLSLSGNAIGDILKGSVTVTNNIHTIDKVTGVTGTAIETVPVASPYLCLFIGIITLITVTICSVYGKKMPKLIPFIIGIVAGYAVAAISTVIGNVAEIDALKVINFDAFKDMKIFSVPEFTFIEAFKGIKDVDAEYIITILVAYVPVAFVVFAEHIADHKNLSSIIEHDLLVDPGLSNTLLGDGVGSMVGAFFGGCPNTTYGESVGCVAITGNASVITIFATAIFAIVISFFDPFVTFLASIPPCVMGGVCMALYGLSLYRALSGFRRLALKIADTSLPLPLSSSQALAALQ